jgi:vanillate O-demethylase monooxygenase subunit
MDVADKPVAAKLLDQRLVVYRTAQSLTVANDLCLHRGAPLSSGRVENGELMCPYHGFRYDGDGRCVCIPAHLGTAHGPHARRHAARDPRFGLTGFRA